MLIDGININAAHFGAMKENEAIKAMIADGFVPGSTEKDKKEWAKKAYRLINPNYKSPEPESKEEVRDFLSPSFGGGGL